MEVYKIIKLQIGGSPCTHWSIAQKNNRETTAEGIGWELFENYRIAKEKFKPDFFLYENNKSAAQPIKDQIAKDLGVGTDPMARFTYINSALVSAQNRQRFYVTNFGDIEQPEDRGILLQNILETRTKAFQNKSYALTTRCQGATPSDTFERHRHTMVAEPVAVDLQVNGRKANPNGEYERVWEARTDGKSSCLTSVASRRMVAEPICAGEIPGHNGKYRNGKQASQQYRVFSIEEKSVCCDTDSRKHIAQPVIFQVPHGFNKGGVKYDKSPTLTANGDWAHNNFVVEWWDGKTYPIYEVKNNIIRIKDKDYPVKLSDGFYIIRKLTVTECCRLQTLPDDYCKAVSATQAYKGLGNGWTAEVIIHLLNHALKDVPRDEEIVVLSMYDGIGTGRYCLDKMGFTNVKYHAYEVDKYAMAVANDNYPDIIQHGDAFAVREDDWSIL